MDYEELYVQMQSLEKDFKDKLMAAQRAFRNLSKNSEKGELKSLSKDLSQMSTFIKDYESILEEYARLTDEFDAREYMESGDFARQMIVCCENLSVDIKGDYPAYEMFPYKVKIDSENQELYVDRKKVQSIRPQYFVKLIKQSQDKLNKASFNVNTFLNELAAAYDTAVNYKEKTGGAKKREPDIMLKELYSYLVPMQRFRRDYDMQSYAFDLARLYNSDITLTKDGRSFQFGSSRNPGKLIRILDADGNEQFLGTVRFFIH